MLISVGVALSLVVSLLLGCAASEENVVIEPMEAEESLAISLDFIGGEDVMPVGAFYGPHVAGYSIDGQSTPNYITDEYFQSMRDVGINMVLQTNVDYASSPALTKQLLHLGEEHKVAIIVNDSEVKTMGEDGSDINMEKLSTRVGEYLTSPAFAGIYVQDEPWTTTFEPASTQPERNLYIREKISKALNTEMDLLTYQNLLSSTMKAENKDLYEEYVRECIETWDMKYILYDRYPFDPGQENYVDRYFFDLAVNRKLSLEYGIPLWTFIQAGSQWNDGMARFDTDTYFPNEGQFDWNVNTSLAFGVQGLAYFPFIQPYYFAYAESKPMDSERNGMIGAWGNKNRWWYFAQDISKQITAVDEVLMNCTHKAVIASGEQALKDMSLIGEYNVLVEGTSWRELKSVEGDAFVGCFNYQGKTALYVVNYDMEYAQKINLEFHNKYNVTVMQQGETKGVQGDGMTLDLLAGDAALLVFE